MTLYGVGVFLASCDMSRIRLANTILKFIYENTNLPMCTSPRRWPGGGPAHAQRASDSQLAVSREAAGAGQRDLGGWCVMRLHVDASAPRACRNGRSITRG